MDAEVEKAWVVTHGAVVDMMLKGIENSQARIIALEDLVMKKSLKKKSISLVLNSIGLKWMALIFQEQI